MIKIIYFSLFSILFFKHCKNYIISISFDIIIEFKDEFKNNEDKGTVIRKVKIKKYYLKICLFFFN